MILKRTHDVNGRHSNEEPGKMHRARKVPITELNQHLTCTLCGGYYIDATTIIECLHTFCRSCIVKYLEANKYCPVCDVQVHKTKPLLNIRPDKTLQDVVYKLVPRLFQNEMQKRREFYASHPDAMPSSLEQRGEASYQHLLSPDETICLSLNYHGSSGPPRYLRCPAAVSVAHLQKLIRAKYDLNDAHRVDVLHNQDTLHSYLTLVDIGYIYLWRRKGPLELTYRIYENTAKRLKLDAMQLQQQQQDADSSSSSCLAAANHLGNNNNNNDWKEVQLRISENGEISVTGIQDATDDLLKRTMNSEVAQSYVMTSSSSSSSNGGGGDKAAGNLVVGLTNISSILSESPVIDAASKAAGSFVEDAAASTGDAVANYTSTFSTAPSSCSTVNQSGASTVNASKVGGVLGSFDGGAMTSGNGASVTTLSNSGGALCKASFSAATNSMAANSAAFGDAVLSRPSLSLSHSTTCTRALNANCLSSVSTTISNVSPSSSAASSCDSTVMALNTTPVALTSADSCATNRPPVATTKAGTTTTILNNALCEKQVAQQQQQRIQCQSPETSGAAATSGLVTTGQATVASKNAQASAGERDRGLKHKLNSADVDEPAAKQPKQTILNHTLGLQNLSNNHPLKKHAQMSRCTADKAASDGAAASKTAVSGTSTFSKPQTLVNKNLNVAQPARPGTPITATQKWGPNKPTTPSAPPCYMPKPAAAYNPIINVPKVHAKPTEPKQQQQQIVAQQGVTVVTATPPTVDTVKSPAIKSKPSTPIGYKTLRDPPKTWNPQISRPTLSRSTPEPKYSELKNVRPPKFFKLRNNMPRYLGNPASGVKPMYQVHLSPEKEKGEGVATKPDKTEIKKHSIVKIDPKTLKPISERAPETSSLSNQSDLKINTSSVPIFNPLKLQSSPKSERKSPKSPHSPKTKSPPSRRDKLNLNFTPPNPFVPNLASPTINPNQFLYSSGPPGFPSYDPRFMAAYHTFLYGQQHMPFAPAPLPGLDLNQRKAGYDMGPPTSPKLTGLGKLPQTSVASSTPTTSNQGVTHKNHSTAKKGKDSGKGEKSLQNAVEKLTQNKIKESAKLDGEKAIRSGDKDANERTASETKENQVRNAGDAKAKEPDKKKENEAKAEGKENGRKEGGDGTSDKTKHPSDISSRTGQDTKILDKSAVVSNNNTESVSIVAVEKNK